MTTADEKLHRPWTVEEDNVVRDTDLTTCELAAATGRSLAAVRRRRGLLLRGITAEDRYRPWGIDEPMLELPSRPCANCRRKFQPTKRRRMLCGKCFKHSS